MIWTRSDTLALANESCAHCRGIGLRTTSRKEDASPCNCVLRSIFRLCFERFVQCASLEGRVRQIQLERRPGKAGHMTWGRKDEEYLADFTNITEHTLTPAEYRLFRYHFILGADYRLCCTRLKIDKGTFFHSVYRIEQKLGKAFRETEPYSLFPLDEYFGGTIRNFPPARRGFYPDWTRAQRLSDRIRLPKAA